MADDSVFQKLTRLFRSGPVVKRKVRQFQGRNSASTINQVFKKTTSHVYSNAMSAYGTYDRLSRYSDFSEMEYTPEISSALDIFSEEATASDDKGQVLHISSENNRIKTILSELFYDTLNVEFNMTPWVRDLTKYGDLFLFNNLDPQYGVISVLPIPVNEIEREEGYDPEDPLAVRFRWITQGNQILENWQVTHFRLLGNDAFLPYGTSMIEPARRIWRQLILLEDSMLVYRVVRSPERRVFYIDVGNVPPEEIPNYMEQAKATLRSNQVVNDSTGRVDKRYNPLSVDEDYFIPTRGGETGTKIETLAGGTNVTAIEDVEYIQKKLFAALKVPRAYLGYDETVSSKSTLSQEDIRFSRTIQRIQKTIITELNKIAIVHLLANGFSGEDLLDFKLILNNPSTIAQQQKLELYRSKFEIAGTAPEGIVDKKYIRKNIFGMTDDEIERIETGRLEDRVADLKVEQLVGPEGGEGGEEGGGFGGGGGGGGGGFPGDFGDDEGGGDDEGIDDLGTDLEGGDTGGDDEPEIDDDEEPEDLEASHKIAGDLIPEIDDEDDEKITLLIDDDDAPIKAQRQIDRYLKNQKRRRKTGREALAMPDHAKMVNHARPDDALNPKRPKNAYRDMIGNPFKDHKEVEVDSINNFLNDGITQQAKLDASTSALLKSIHNSSRIVIDRTSDMITEDTVEIEELLDESIEFIFEDDNEAGE